MKFYKHILQPLYIKDFTNTIFYDFDENEIEKIEEETKFYSSSSCLIKNLKNKGYIMNTRYVNYYIFQNNNYVNCEKNIISLNKYIELDENFIILNEKLFYEDYLQTRYIGVEDIKIFNETNNDVNQIKFIGTGFHKNNKLGIVVGDYNTENKKLIPNEIKSNFNDLPCEKNWVFIDYKNSTHIIYKWNPLQICKLDNQTNLINIIEEKKMPDIFSHIRGSSCGYKYNKTIDVISDNVKFFIKLNEIWFITHIVSYENPRHYYHMFVIFDESMNLMRYSAPFSFEGEPIEYSLSVLVEDDKVLVNYSTWDRTTKIAVFDKKYIDSIIKYTI